ncbi:hypothetical protein BH20ACT5_BH20ACT5_12080 [soil metagenome]
MTLARRVGLPAAGVPAGLVLLAPPTYAEVVDVAEVRDDLADDGVAVVGAVDETGLAEAVAEVRGDGLELSVVVLDEAPTGGVEALAQELRGSDDLTVLVLTPDQAAASSGTLDQGRLDDALGALGGSDVEAVRGFADVALDPGLPWAWLIAAGVVLAIVLTVGGRWWEARRRRARDSAALAAEGARLRAEVDSFGDDIVELEPRVLLVQDQAVRDEFSTATISYGELRDTLSRAPGSRKEAAKLEARIDEVRARLHRVRAAADAATAGT